MSAAIVLIPVLVRALLSPVFQDPTPVTVDLAAILAQLLALGGFASLSAALINAGKQFGLIKDGQAPTYSLVLNLIGLIVLVALRLFAPEADITGGDGILQTVSQILVYILALVAQLGISKTANTALKGTPVIGYSHSGEKAKAQAKLTS